eukprot:gene25388-11051_t
MIRVDLGTVNMIRVDLGTVNMIRVDLGTVNMIRVDLGTVNMIRVDLGTVNMIRVDLGSVNMIRVDLGTVNMIRVDLGMVNMIRVDLGTVNMIRIDLGTVNMIRVDLGTVNMIRVDLGTVNMIRVYLGTGSNPDPWKAGANNTTEGGGRKLNENKLLSKKNRIKLALSQLRINLVLETYGVWDRGLGTNSRHRMYAFTFELLQNCLCEMCGKKIQDNKKLGYATVDLASFVNVQAECQVDNFECRLVISFQELRRLLASEPMLFVILEGQDDIVELFGHNLDMTQNRNASLHIYSAYTGFKQSAK